MLRAAIRYILEQERRSPHPEKWSVQGFGMLRMYLDDAQVYRLNVWDHRIMVPNVSVIHDHPWDFESTVISGILGNIRYRMYKSKRFTARPYLYTVIKTGEGGGPVASHPSDTWLYESLVDIYHPGDSYKQRADEIHETSYITGTVTLNKRTPVSKESHARVFWPKGTEWVDAMPRPAAVHEIDLVLDNALRKWDE